MDGFPISRYVNQSIGFLTDELIRLNPEYRSLLPARLKARVREAFLSTLEEGFPTIYREFCQEETQRKGGDLIVVQGQAEDARGLVP